MRWIEIDGCEKINGSVDVPGSKNSAIPILTACCLANEKVILKNVPHISDIQVIYDIFNEIGISIFIDDNNNVNVDASNIYSTDIDSAKSSKYRAAYYFVGALLAKYKRISIGYPGGDNFGSRPIDQHIKGLEALGAKFSFYENYYVVEADKLLGATIYFDVVTCGATINVLLAAVLAEGRSVLRNAARDPEVVDLAIFLNKLGAKIKGAGTDTIIIDGVESLSGTNHTIIPDRLITGSLLMSVGIVGGHIAVNNIIPEHLLPCTAKLEETGMAIKLEDNSIRASSDTFLKGINIKTAMYPGFATDLQQPITALLIGADSHSTIVDTIYPHRFKHCIELNKMGADIILRDGNAVIPGRKKLKGTWVHASDVRAGICLILAALGAEGTTRITGIEHIERGYEDIVTLFSSLGANIRICEDLTLSKDDIDADIM
ncbi:UDP-N-acetylglucosamine 1-carboxyvinyltransferase [Clostridium sp. 19966]|uniref:UDP-N-acetylglucosamine 1-carboxyvinyltransferase n=1 Tax=Clostridium sp. 19966 TaxID=2768166 RepID=UPI0028DD778B|nr:UDP-N-acetylglucosamine 1-carboxyvinyltransferase [Clostridium sp. 19966]MDT8715170.1 UDP-N-acetylglucosamine 1-carboxyvinyltransferase [Clostridium sp. 19966]